MERAEELFQRVIRNGEAAIDEMICDRESEHLFLDFKRSSDDGDGKRLSMGDRKSLARAVAGFANSEGGIVVWGIDCSTDDSGADVARYKAPLTDPARFVSWLESAVSGVTVPAHARVKSHPVVGAGGRGFAVTYIPKSDLAPHQTVPDLRYFIRAGSSFVPAPHAVLAGLFGRRPNPYVFHKVASEPATLETGVITIPFVIMIRNQGPGVATDLFLTFIAASAGDESQIRFEIMAEEAWTSFFTFGLHLSMMSKPEIRLPPEAHIPCARVFTSFRPPFDEDFQFRGTAGAGNSPPDRFELGCAKVNIKRIYNAFVAAHRAKAVDDTMRYEVARRLLGVAST